MIAPRPRHVRVDEIDSEVEAALRRAFESAASTAAGEREVEIRAGHVNAESSTFSPGIGREEFDNVLIHTSLEPHGWSVLRKWNFSIDYAARLPANSLQDSFTVRVGTHDVEPDMRDKRVLGAFPSTRCERVSVKCVCKQRVSVQDVASEHARVAFNLEREVHPFQLYVDASFVRAKVRLSLVKHNGWRLDLSRVWQAASRSEIDRMLRDRCEPHRWEMELEAPSSAFESPASAARQGATLWSELCHAKMNSESSS